jgi:hypothetical protein
MAEALTDSQEILCVLYYGDGGTGKTTDLAHMADLGKVVIVNAERGVKRSALERSGVNVDNIEVWPPPGEKVTYEGLEAEWLRLYEALNKDPDAYVGWIWDSLTEVYNVLFDSVKLAGEEWEARTQKKRDPRSDYGDTNDQVRKLIRKARDLPCHFGASALERRDQDNDGTIVYRPSIAPGLMKDMAMWFDIIVHKSVVEVGEDEQYVGLFKPLGKYRGKDRFKVMPRQVVSPSFDRVLAYVEESLTAPDDPVMQKAQKERDAQKKNTKKTEDE